MRPLVLATVISSITACGGGSKDPVGGDNIVLAGSCTYAAQADLSDQACQQYQVSAASVDLFRTVKEAECNAQLVHTWSTGHCPDSPCIGCCSKVDQDGMVTTQCWMGSSYAGLTASACPAGWFWTTTPP